MNLPKIILPVVVLASLFSAYQLFSISSRAKLEITAKHGTLNVSHCTDYTAGGNREVVIQFIGTLEEGATEGRVSYTADKKYRQNNNLPAINLNLDNICNTPDSPVKVWIYANGELKMRGNESINFRINDVASRKSGWTFVTAVLFVLSLILIYYDKKIKGN
ncbi:hypothetical protein [Lewinella sp. W8]|uniref:hypothetical protein n=1 Tax=Lewinella sp. W8 TaxID=2528208 RepID=UPI0010676207|nr:hypothetical protein [Lewinella sp. W8]MTB52348.1 hypothetical protein [Lewinella sp. W8]